MGKINGLTKFLDTFLDKIKEIGIDVSNYNMDHVAYRASSAEDYENTVNELKVNGVSWGIFSSLELLRLKSLLENNDLKGMLENIPVRSDGSLWEKNSNDFQDVAREQLDFACPPGMFELEVTAALFNLDVKIFMVL